MANPESVRSPGAAHWNQYLGPPCQTPESAPGSSLSGHVTLAALGLPSLHFSSVTRESDRQHPAASSQPQVAHRAAFSLSLGRSTVSQLRATLRRDMPEAASNPKGMCLLFSALLTGVFDSPARFILTCRNLIVMPVTLLVATQLGFVL